MARQPILFTDPKDPWNVSRWDMLKNRVRLWWRHTDMTAWKRRAWSLALVMLVVLGVRLDMGQPAQASGAPGSMLKQMALAAGIIGNTPPLQSVDPQFVDTNGKSIRPVANTAGVLKVSVNSCFFTDGGFSPTNILATSDGGTLYVGNVGNHTGDFGIVSVCLAPTLIPSSAITGRQSLLIENDGEANLRCGFDTTVSARKGMPVTGSGGTYKNTAAEDLPLYCVLVPLPDGGTPYDTYPDGGGCQGDGGGTQYQELGP